MLNEVSSGGALAPRLSSKRAAIMNKKQINWLLNEIKVWRGEALVSAEIAEQLASRYEQVKRDQTPVGLIVLGSLGALLTGLGIISLLAANWGTIPRDIRGLIAFMPLSLSYCAALFILLRLKPSLALYEPLGIFWGLSIGAGIALIAQTYHLPGDLESFILTWVLLLVPVVWLTRSLGCVAGFYIGLLLWAGYVQSNHGVTLWYWPLSALIFPLVIDVKRRSPTGMRGVFMFWSLLFSSIAALVMNLERTVPGLWIVICVSFFTVMLLVGNLIDNHESEMWSKPLSLCGAGGLAVVLSMLCYEWPWKDVGPEHYRYQYGYHSWASYIYDFPLTIILLVAALFLLFRWWRRCTRDSGCDKLTKFLGLFWYASPLVITVFYGIAAYAAGRADEICALLATLYLAILCLTTIASGIAARRLWMVNCGMLLFLALVIGKFFSTEYSFTVKGVVFIVSGLIFFIANAIFTRKLREEARS